MVKRFELNHFCGAIVLLAAISGCATRPTVYEAAGADGRGYSDIQIESNRFSLTFEGGPDASRAEVNGYAMLRAADLTRNNGHDWFRVISRSSEVLGQKRESGTNVGVGIGGGGGRTSVGVGVGIDLTPDRTAYVTTLEIFTGKAPAPDDDDVYDALEVQAASQR